MSRPAAKISQTRKTAVKQFSTFFTLPELVRSDTAVSLKIHNLPNVKQLENLSFLANEILDNIRLILGKPIRITSGFRSKKLNEAIGGKVNSFHLEGLAADLQNQKGLEEIAKSVLERKVNEGKIKGFFLKKYEERNFIHLHIIRN